LFHHSDSASFAEDQKRFKKTTKMIDAIQRVIENIQTFERTSDQILIDLAKNRQRQIIKFNTDQLDSGQASDGSEVQPSYRPSTIERKKRKGQPYDRVTLKDEGDFHASFFVRFGSDQKRVYLERKYGTDIYGLSPENLGQLIGLINDDFIEALRRQITA
jgi:hypothetical protein